MPTGTNLYSASLGAGGTASANNNSVGSKPALYITHAGPGNLTLTVTTRTQAAAGVEREEESLAINTAMCPYIWVPDLFNYPFTEFDLDILSNGACSTIVIDVCEA